MTRQNFSTYVRPIILSIVFSTSGSIIMLLLTRFMGVEMSKTLKSVCIFLITSLFALIFFPLVFRIPFGRKKPLEWLKALGVYLPQKFAGHILLGLLLGLVSLSGMLLGSIFTGKYVFDTGNITAGHIIFSLTPGIWEEVFFRGIVMIVLIRYYKSLVKAFWLQAALFAICHIGSLSWTIIPDILAVFLIGITFSLAAVKTRSLVAGMLFHFIHDAFLFVVQNPGGEYQGFEDNATFYFFLGAAMLVNIMIIILFSEKLGVKGEKRIYEEAGAKDTLKFSRFEASASAKSKKIERFVLLMVILGLVPTLLDAFSKQYYLFVVLLSVLILLNLLVFRFYFRAGPYVAAMISCLNGAGLFLSAWLSKAGGSERVYIIIYLAGVLYFLIAPMLLLMRNRENNEEDGDLSADRSQT